ncbi:MAG: hypothetical protein OEV37_03365 [Candidatus Berkelbacteria bacterium]|nr:hypothetical protein [Candidatus Berkelbacteria bacterium]
MNERGPRSVEGRREQIITELRSLRDDWSDEIPDQIVDSTSGLRTKARNQWFQNVISWIEMGIEVGLFSQQVMAELENFDKYIEETQFRSRIKNPEDIKRGKMLLTHALAELGI